MFPSFLNVSKGQNLKLQIWQKQSGSRINKFWFEELWNSLYKSCFVFTPRFQASGNCNLEAYNREMERIRNMTEHELERDTSQIDWDKIAKEVISSANHKFRLTDSRTIKCRCQDSMAG